MRKFRHKKPRAGALATFALIVPVLMALAAPAVVYAEDDGGSPNKEEGVDPATGELSASNAQAEDQEVLDAIGGIFGNMFKTEPLTEEQQARVPLASRLVERVMPEGTLDEMMGSTYDNILGPIMKMSEDDPKAAAAKNLGMSGFELDLDADQASELATMLDPAWKTRQSRELALIPDMMKSVMAAIEPSMRKAMAEVYAVNFTTKELGEIEAFFSTPTGADYARKSYKMAGDPRILGASMKAMPAMMEAIGSLRQKAEEATADLPPKRKFEDFSEADLARIAQLTGLSADEVEQKMAAAAKASEKSPF